MNLYGWWNLAGLCSIPFPGPSEKKNYFFFLLTEWAQAQSEFPWPSWCGGKMVRSGIGCRWMVFHPEAGTAESGRNRKTASQQERNLSGEPSNPTVRVRRHPISGRSSPCPADLLMDSDRRFQGFWSGLKDKSLLFLPECCNGSQVRLKIWCRTRRAGSSPASGTDFHKYGHTSLLFLTYNKQYISWSSWKEYWEGSLIPTRSLPRALSHSGDNSLFFFEIYK